MPCEETSVAQLGSTSGETNANCTYYDLLFFIKNIIFGRYFSFLLRFLLHPVAAAVANEGLGWNLHEFATKYVITLTGWGANPHIRNYSRAARGA